jgi:hypothetical protein
VQWSASVVFGDVMEIAKLMVLLIMLILTACGLYRNRCRPGAVQSQASSSPNTHNQPRPWVSPTPFPLPYHLVHVFS